MFYSNNHWDGEKWNAHYSMKDLRIVNPQIFLNFNVGANFDLWWQGLIYANYPVGSFVTDPLPQPDKIQAFKSWFYSMWNKALVANIGVDAITGLALPALYNLMVSDSIFRQTAKTSVGNEGLWGPLYLEMIPYYDVEFNSVKIISRQAYNLAKVGIKINGQYYLDIFPGDEIVIPVSNIRRIDMIQYGAERPILDFYFTDQILNASRKQIINFKEAYTGDSTSYYLGQIAGNDTAEYRAEYIQQKGLEAVLSGLTVIQLNLDFYLISNGTAGTIAYAKGSIASLYDSAYPIIRSTIGSQAFGDYWQGYTIDGLQGQLWAPGQINDVLALIHYPLDTSLNNQKMFDTLMIFTDNVYGNKQATRKSRLTVNLRKLEK